MNLTGIKEIVDEMEQLVAENRRLLMSQQVPMAECYSCKKPYPVDDMEMQNGIPVCWRCADTMAELSFLRDDAIHERNDVEV